MRNRSLRSLQAIRPRAIQRVPSFESGILAEPLLSFGGQHTHIDPKLGLSLYGPHSPAGQNEPLLSSITVGSIGPASMLADADQWLTACSHILYNDGTEPFQHPHFPGFNRDHPFRCELRFGDTWREIVKEKDLSLALKDVNFHERIRQVVELYVAAIQVLAEREPRPHVIVCCIPQEVIDLCTVRVTKAGEVKRIRVSKFEKKALLVLLC